MSRKIPYSHQTIGSDDIRAVLKVLKSDWLTGGLEVEKLETALAKYCQAKYAVVCSSGTAALHLAYLALGLKKGDEVITTPLTFSATSAGFCYLGVKPVFCDIDPATLNIDPLQIESKITQKTKAIAIVDFAGLACDFDLIKKIAQKHHLPVVEDAAHALGSVYRGRKVGSLADLTCFSFHPVKTITAGEGGAVVTNNKKLTDKVRLFRSHGIVRRPRKAGWYYEIKEIGYNYRLTDFQCALALSQLKKVDRFIKQRRCLWARYNKAFEFEKEIILPCEPKGHKPAWHLYVAQFRAKNRKNIYEQLKKQGIFCQVHYIPLHLQPYYQKMFGYRKGQFPKAEKYYQRCLSLPLFPGLGASDQNRVIKSIKSIIAKQRTQRK